MAMSDERVYEALAPASLGDLEQSYNEENAVYAGETPGDAVNHLEQLAHDIVATPGAGGALLLAFAAQARALSLVMEAALRTQGAAGLPAEVMAAVQNALRPPAQLAGLNLA
jgi:hypothetical protein